MTSYLTILTTAAGQLATKSFIRDGGQITKLPTRMAKFFTVERRPVETIRDLAAVLTELNLSPHKFVIRGEPLSHIADGHFVRRLKHGGRDCEATFRSHPNGQGWICLDFDNIPLPDGVFPARDFENAMLYLRDMLPEEFQGVTFWAQLSSSAGINGWDKISAHLWFMLDCRLTDERLNYWATNIDTPIDPRLFNAVQPHFTAAPIFAYDVADPCPVRCGTIKGTSNVVCLDLSKADESKRIAENSRNAQSHAKRTRAAPRLERTQSRSRHPQMGIRRREDQRANSNRPAIILKRPLLSEWLTTYFQPKTS